MCTAKPLLLHTFTDWGRATPGVVFLAGPGFRSHQGVAAVTQVPDAGPYVFALLREFDIAITELRGKGTLSCEEQED